MITNGLVSQRVKQKGDISAFHNFINTWMIHNTLDTINQHLLNQMIPIFLLDLGFEVFNNYSSLYLQVKLWNHNITTFFHIDVSFQS